ncbi:MAG: molybdopterin cofactor-binding domain-containing protein [Pseudomonadota bacterium]
MSLTDKTDVTRRQFLKVTALSGGGLMLSLSLPALSADDEHMGTLIGSGDLNAFVKIDSDGVITIYASNPEMGQGVRTSLPMIIAEEMGAKWEDVVVEQAPVDGARFGRQSAGGSTTIPRSFQQMREMGASAKAMLIGAAAQLLEKPKQEFDAANSEVSHESGRSFTFGQLAALAVKQPVPSADELVYKDPREYTIIGTSVSGVDNLVIATGLARFGIDTVVDDMLYASYQKCPAFGGRAVSANLDEIRKLPGITHAFVLAGNGRADQLLSGVAIVGTSTWHVFNAKKQLKVEWDESGASKDSWEGLVAQAEAVQDKPGFNILNKGLVDPTLKSRKNKVVESFYTYPFVAHATMEPMNCTVDYREVDGGAEAEVWAPSQAPQGIPDAVSNVTGAAKERITVHQTRMGGAFGRRFVADFVCEAAAISKEVGKPIKLTWTREDDMQFDFYRVGGFQKMRGAVDRKGKLVAWDQHFIGMRQNGRPVMGAWFQPGEFPLPQLENVRASQTLIDIGTPCGAWRAPGANTHAFVVQSFIHELATAGKRDHVEFLLEIMGEPQWDGKAWSLNTGRAADVVKLAADKSGWGRRMPKGRGLGLAFHFSHAGHIAEVAEVSVDADRQITLHKMTVAVDIGPIINMSGATSQVEGSVIDGYSTMLGQKITMENGRVEQSNFHDYPVLRIKDAPEIDVHFLQSDNPPTGIGEPALPPVAPAIANAIYAASGIRVRAMPLSDEGIAT